MRVYIHKHEEVWSVAAGIDPEDAAAALTWYFRQTTDPNQLEEADQEFIDKYIDPEMLDLGETVYIGYFIPEKQEFRYPEIDSWEIAFSRPHPLFSGSMKNYDFRISSYFALAMFESGMTKEEVKRIIARAHIKMDEMSPDGAHGEAIRIMKEGKNDHQN